MNVHTEGFYTVSLRRWPVEANLSITSALDPAADVPGADRAFRAHPGKSISATLAILEIDEKELETKPVQAGDREVVFTTRLAAGAHRLAPVFRDDHGNEVGAYYATITHQP